MDKERIVIGDYCFHGHDTGREKSRRYIDAITLCGLYGFNPEECILVEMNKAKTWIGLDSTLPRYTVRCESNDYSLKEAELSR